MTVKECYEAMNGNYEDAKSRLMTDKLIEKFMLKFPKDETMQQLNAALQAADYETAFRCAHTLKGVAANLGFTGLQSSSSALTELLRVSKSEPDAAMVQTVREDYALVLKTLEMYQNA